MNNKLITALRLTANALEAGTFTYNWSRQSRCNCGSLFCALSGRTAIELSAAVGKRSDCVGPDRGATWTEMAGVYCPITGMTTDKLFKELLGYGLTVQDITELEYLKNPQVLARLGKRQLDYRDPLCAAAYMRAWADLLVAQAQGEPTAEPIIVPEQEPPLRRRTFIERVRALVNA